MKALFTIILVIGALLLPASKGLRDTVIAALSAIAGGVERLVMRGDYAEIRLVDDNEFDDVIREPGRLVVVVIQKELTASSRGHIMDLDHAMKELPGDVLIAKVIAERNSKLIGRLKITEIPSIRVYREGHMLRKFDVNVETDDFVAYISARLRDKPADYRKDEAPDIRPMKEDWLPPGVEKNKEAVEVK